METKLNYRHRVVTGSDVVFIRKLIAEHPQASRRALSKKLCEAWNWVQANGALRDLVCRGLMLKLHREGLIELPAVRQVPCNPLAERHPPTPVSVDAVPLRASLAEMGAIEWRQVRRTPEEALFNSLLERHHYLGYTQPVGEQLKYLVYAKGWPIACLAWSSAPRHLGPRDRFIGWCAEARRKNIRLLAYNTRFLILPWVVVPHLASHVLGRIARVLPAEWGAPVRTPDLLFGDFRRSAAIPRHLLPCRQLDPPGLYDGARQGRADQETQPPGQGSAGISAHEGLSAAAG